MVRSTEKLSLKKLIPQLKQAFLLVWNSAGSLTVIGLVMLLIQGVLPLLTLYITKLVVDEVTVAMSAVEKGAAFRQVVLYIVLLGLTALVSYVFGSLVKVVSDAQALKVTDHVYDILHQKSIEVDLEYYENSEYYDTLHRAQGEAPYKPQKIVNGLLGVLQNGITLIAISVLLFSFNWIIAIILFAAAFPGIFVRLRFADKFHEWRRVRTETERQSWYYHWILTGEAFAKEVRLFNLGPRMISRFRELRQKLRKEKVSLSLKNSMFELLSKTAPVITVFGAFAFIAHKSVTGAISLGALVMYFQAFQKGQNTFQGVLRGLADLYEDNIFLSYLNSFFDLESRVPEPENPKPIPLHAKSGFRLENLSFTYSSGSHLVLDDVSMEIPSGKVVALVGENGSGKTTLVKLLCRLYDPQDGKISLDGIDIRDFSKAEFRKLFSIIFQDFSRYQSSVKNNIGYGNIEADSPEARIIEAARNAGAHDFIQKLPKQYETMLGTWFEGGEELSLGEWQKIALARAFMRDSEMIILDEPTSSLDARSEYELFNRFRKLIRGRSAVIISHRFSTVRMADLIYVLHSGRIIESGSHESLIQDNGMYARLFEIQARNYR